MIRIDALRKQLTYQHEQRARLLGIIHNEDLPENIREDARADFLRLYRASNIALCNAMDKAVGM